MAKQLVRCLLALTAVAGLVPPASAQRVATATAGSLDIKEPTKGIEQSSCVLMLKSSPRYPTGGMGTSTGGVVDLPALTTAMTTSGLIDPAAKESLGLSPREWPAVVRIEISQAGTQAVKLSVSVSTGNLEKPEPAAALLRELVNRAKDVASQSAEARRLELKTRLDEIEKRRAETRVTLESLRQRTGEADTKGFRGPNESFVIQRRQLEMELAAKRPRLQAIKEVLSRNETDEVGKALRALVASREALVAGLEKASEQGKGDPLELLRARVDLAEARVRVAEGGKVPSSTPSRNVRDERQGLEVDIATLEAQLKALPAADAAKPADDPQMARAELFRVQAESSNLEQQYQQARRDYEQLAAAPVLVILDGQK